MKIYRVNLKVILPMLLCLAILSALLVPAIPAAAGTGYSPIIVWLGTNSYTVSPDDYTTLLTSYPVSINGTYGTHTYSYTGVPIYKMLEFAFPDISSLSGYGVLTSDNINFDSGYKVIYGPNVMDNTTVKGNNNLIIATSGTLDGSSGTNFPRSACSTATAGNRFNNNVAAIKLQYAVQVTAPTNGTITPASGWFSGSNNPWTNSTPPALGVDYNASQQFNIAPGLLYHIASVTVDSGAVVPNVSSYTFNNVIANHTLSATFSTGTQDWPLQIVGYSTVNLSKSDFESIAAAHPSNIYASIDKNTGNPDGNQWKGVALWRLIGLVDGSGGTTSNATTFNSSLAGTYSIKLTGSDGFSKTIPPPYSGFTFQSPTEDLFVAKKVSLNGTSTWTDLPLTSPTDAAKLWYPTIDTGSGITVGNLRIASLVKIELLNLPVIYTIATSSNGNGSVSSNATNVASGGSATITMTPYSGYHIASLTDNQTDVTGQVTINNSIGTYTLSNVSANHTIAGTFASNTAGWTLQLIKGATTYNLLQSEFEGMTQVTLPPITDMHGTHTYSGVPAWKLAAKVDGSNGSFNDTLAATNYNLKAVSTGSNPYVRCVGPTSSNTTIARNDNLIIANMVDGALLDSNTGPLKIVGTDLISSRSVSQLASLELVYTVNVDINLTNGSIVPVGNQADRDGIVGVSFGANQTLNIVPSSGYQIATLSVGGVSVTPASTYTFNNMSANHTISATFTPIPVTTYTISTSTDGNGTVSANATTVNSGGSCTVTLTPNSGYHIATLTDNQTDVTNQVSINNNIGTYNLSNVSANHSIAGTFALTQVISVGVSPSTQNVAAGLTFNAYIVINTNVASRGWQTNVNFDASRLTCNSVAEGTFLSAYAAAHGGGTISGGASTIDNSGGHVTIPGYAISSAGISGPSGTGILCTLAFTAKTSVTGNATIMPSAVVISDVNGTTLTGVTVTGGNVTIAAASVTNVIAVNLAAGWNTFSTPVSLDPGNNHNTWSVITAGSNFDQAFYFDSNSQRFVTPGSDYILKPCEAVYIHLPAAYTISLTVNQSLTFPPSENLNTGWNLISLANLNAMKVNDALLSISQVTGDHSGYAQVLSQAVGSQAGWVYVKGQANPAPDMQPYYGYWVFMINSGTLAGFTTTPLSPGN